MRLIQWRRFLIPIQHVHWSAISVHKIWFPFSKAQKSHNLDLGLRKVSSWPWVNMLSWNWILSNTPWILWTCIFATHHACAIPLLPHGTHSPLVLVSPYPCKEAICTLSARSLILSLVFFWIVMRKYHWQPPFPSQNCYHTLGIPIAIPPATSW